MPIYHGSDLIESLYHGGDAIGRVYHGSDLVFDSGGTVPSAPTTPFAYDYTSQPWDSGAVFATGFYDAATDKTYLAWESQCQFRHIKVAYWDHATDTPSTPVVVDSHALENDNHGKPALEKLSDGRLVCVYGCHNSDVLWAISGQSGGIPNITSWTKQTPLADTGNGYSYPKPINIDAGSGAGTLHLFARKTIDTSSADNMRMVLFKATYTSGGAVTFGAETAVINFDGGSGARVYAFEVRLHSGNIEFCTTRSDLSDTTRQDVHYFRYIPGTGAKENLDGSVSTAGAVDLTTANASYRIKTSSGSNITGSVSWCRDSNGNLHIAYGDDTTNPWNVTHDWHDGTGWQGETTAFTVNRKGSAGFVENWCLVPNGASVAAYYPANNNGGFTGRGGDDMARKQWTSGSWGTQVIVLEGDEVTAWGHPQAIRDAHADLRVVFSQVSQDENLTSLALMERCFLGDSGYLEWPAPSDAHAFKNILVMNFGGSDGATSTTDESGWKNLHPVTFNGNAQLDNTLAPPWGTAWLKLDGTGDYLTIAQSRSGLPDGGDWQILEGDTWEVVFRLNEVGRVQYILSTRTAGASPNGFALAVTAANKLRVLGFSAGATPVSITGATTLAVSTLYKAGVKRTASGWAAYLNGVSDGTAPAASYTAGSSSLYIGRNADSTSNDFNGWIKQIRLTKLAGRDLTIVPSADFPVS